MDNNQDDWSKQFNSLLSSPLGVELIRTLREDVYANLVADAVRAKSQENAFGLLKEAGGVIKAIEHLQFKSVTPSDEGSKGQ